METSVPTSKTVIPVTTSDIRVGFLRGIARYVMLSLLVLSDLLGLLVSYTTAILFWSLVNPVLDPVFYVALLPFLLIFIASYLLSGLYTLGSNTVDELRRLTISTTVVVFALGALTFWLRTAEMYSRAAFGIGWALAIFLLPAFRSLMRTICSKLAMWGEPAVVFGYGSVGQQVVSSLLSHPKLGIVPVVAVDDQDHSSNFGTKIPIVHPEDLEHKLRLTNAHKIRTAVLVMSEIKPDQVTTLLEKQANGFSRLIMISEPFMGGSINVQPFDLGGYLGLEVKQNLLSKFQQNVKRIMEIGIILAGSVVLLPVFSILALLIRLDSRGEIFFTHQRIGQGGKPICVWKFRTMRPDADSVLKECLATNPELRHEWEATQKIKNDPRVTRVGKFLRKFSLDELPQLWNVLIGEMSLVGPRPIINQEIRYYGDRFSLYARVKPGLTGLWQVSGRNDVGYRQRVQMDEFYVRNWSVWLDLYILAKTILVVIKGDGAY